MKRDMELIRLLLLELETGKAPPGLAGYSTEDQVYNLRLMSDANLIVAEFIKDSGGKDATAAIDRMTWSGHDFLDATRDSKIWKKAKEHILKPGVAWTFQVLMDYLKRQIDERVRGDSPSP